jgi:hypothetical protein
MASDFSLARQKFIFVFQTSFGGKPLHRNKLDLNQTFTDLTF